MEPTTTGRFRVLDRRPDGAILLVDLDAAAAAVADPHSTAAGDLQPIAVQPVVVADAESAGDDSDTLADRVTSLEPGYVIAASLQWDDSEARFSACEIVTRTRIQYADAITGIFEKAQETWHDAQVAGAAMNSAVTYSTGKEPNGVVYVFAKQEPPRDLFEEFRTGATPIEPLIQRVDVEHAADDEMERDNEPGTTDEAETDDQPGDEERAVFVMNPADEEFVLLYIVFRKEGMLAKTVRDTYGLPPV